MALHVFVCLLVFFLILFLVRLWCFACPSSTHPALKQHPITNGAGRTSGYMTQNICAILLEV